MGLVLAIIAGLAAIAAIVLTSLYVIKKRNERSPMLAYAVTLADIEAGNVRFPGQPKPKKHKAQADALPVGEEAEADEENEEITEKGEEEC